MQKSEEEEFIKELIKISKKYKLEIHVPQLTEENKDTDITILCFDLKKHALIIDPKN